MAAVSLILLSALSTTFKSLQSTLYLLNGVFDNSKVHDIDDFDGNHEFDRNYNKKRDDESKRTDKDKKSVRL